jgi:hypothetical protein
MEHKHIKELSPAEQQAWADFNEHEKHRHIEDILKIDEEARWMKKELGIEARDIFVGVYIEVH